MILQVAGLCTTYQEMTDNFQTLVDAFAVGGVLFALLVWFVIFLLTPKEGIVTEQVKLIFVLIQLTFVVRWDRPNPPQVIKVQANIFLNNGRHFVYLFFCSTI